MLSTAPVPASGSAGVELGTAQPQLVLLSKLYIGYLDQFIFFADQEKYPEEAITFYSVLLVNELKYKLCNDLKQNIANACMYVCMYVPPTLLHTWECLQEAGLGLGNSSPYNSAEQMGQRNNNHFIIIFCHAIPSF